MAKASDPEACRECEAPDAQRTYQPLGITGKEWPGGKHSKQLGRTFESAAEVDAYCEKEGLEPVSRNSRAWQGMINRNREAREVEAKAEGKEYHDEHGNEGKRNVDDAQVWGTGLLSGE
jgi:hypothetical protein